MVYLDYAATTPMSLEALDIYVKTSKDFIGAMSSNNLIGKKSKKLMEDTTKELSNIFNVMDREIIYTSGASEANNMALIGVCLANHKNGRHIITSKLEHPSIYEICSYLENIGFEVSYVDNDEDGLISFEHLKSLVREDTILVSISAVNYETGVRQPLKMIRQIVKKENEQTLIHSDLSQAIGKTQVNFRDIDLGSVSAHKFYGPQGVGFLYKNDAVKITPLLYGNKNNKFKPGMPALPLIVSMVTALKNSLKDMDKREKYVNLLNDRIVEKMSKIEGIYINKTKYSIPFILNISFDKVVSEQLEEKLSNKDIYVNVNLNNEVSSSVLAIYNDIKRSKSSMRISLSHLTTVLEINRFLEEFELEYKNMI